MLTNNGQELTQYRFEFKCGTKGMRKFSLSVLRFEPALANYATPLLSATLMNKVFVGNVPRE
jgi:hypothetical protein